MRKILSVVIGVFLAATLNAQYAGYTMITDMAQFKVNFSAASKKTATIKSDFVQEKNLSMLSEKITSKGKFWFKKESMVRMEYNQPFQYLMIINKDKVYIKDGQKVNTVSTKSNKIFQQINRITVDCVQGTVLDNPDFKTRIFENKNSYQIELIPVAKGLKGLFKTINVIMEKRDYGVSSIQMNELGGDDTLIRFVNKEINTNIADAFFTVK